MTWSQIPSGCVLQYKIGKKCVIRGDLQGSADLDGVSI